MNQLANVGDALRLYASIFPDKIGARDLDRAMTFRQWRDRSARLANALLGFGLKKGDRVCVLAYNCVEWLEIYAAMAFSGLVMVPVNFAPWLWGWPNLFLKRMADAGTEIILTGPYSPGDPGTVGVDTAEDAARVPAGFDGYVWTNEIATIAPSFRAQN